MEITEGVITENLGDYQVENTLFTYDENEQEQNKINKNNAGLLFKPKFIPFYPKLLELGLTINESLVFGFIDFYLQNNSDKFYFTNEQIGKLFGFGEQNTSNIIKRLKDKGLIETKYRLKSNGGKIRFIQKLYSDYNKNYSPTITKVIDNNNKINNNNINIINNNTEFENSEFLENNNSLSINNLDLKEKEKSCAKKEKEITVEINNLITELKNTCNELGVAYNKDMERQFSKHILTAKEYGEFCEKIGQTRVEFALNVLKVSVAIGFFRGALSGPKLIYKHYAELYNQAKQKSQKFQNASVDVL